MTDPKRVRARFTVTRIDKAVNPMRQVIVAEGDVEGEAEFLAALEQRVNEFPEVRMHIWQVAP